MRVLVLENNLMWSPRLANGLRALGHEPIVLERVPAEWPSADAAIVNLGVPAFVAVVGDLEAKGVSTVGHAGHKEKEILDLGREAGCSRIATNSQIANRLADFFPTSTEPLPEPGVKLPG